MWTLERSLFVRLICAGIEPVLLRTQYRCHPVLSSVASALFYCNRLLDGVSADERPPVVEGLPPLCWCHVPAGVEKLSISGSYSNDEARVRSNA